MHNRLYLEAFLEQAVARCKRFNNKLAVLFLDLNEFKPINDTHGHAAGDAVLKEISARLSAYACETDLVSRLGGDEFCLVIPDLNSTLCVDEIMARINDSLLVQIITEWGP
ncbi:MAG: GGDEF domain-containing protein [Gammaproteobacteria bacterium]|nr:GGDEF domain-containing protein [Gammaproteobacteria bacterium]